MQKKIFIIIFVLLFLCQTSYAKNYEGPSSKASKSYTGGRKVRSRSRSISRPVSRPVYFDTNPCDFNTLSEETQLHNYSKFCGTYAPKDGNFCVLEDHNMPE